MLLTWSLYLCRRRPTLPHTYACSTIGPARLNFRVRDGNGCFPCGKITGFVDVDAIRVVRLPAWVSRTAWLRRSRKELSTRLLGPHILRRADALLRMTNQIAYGTPA